MAIDFNSNGDGEMSNSAAFDDIGPSGPRTRSEIAGRIRRARDHLKMAEERLNEGELGMAARWLQRAADEAAAIEKD